MDNILSFNGKKFDMDTINYFEDVTKGYSKGLVYATKVVKNDGTSKTFCGKKFHLYDNGPGSLAHSISYETSTPTTNYLSYCINLNQVKSVNINFDQLDKKESLAFLNIAFKDNSSLMIEDDAEAMCNFHITPFIHGITYCNGYDECGEMDIKDMGEVAFDINVATDRSVPVPEWYRTNLDVFLLKSLKDQEDLFPENVKVKEISTVQDNTTDNTTHETYVAPQE